MSQTSSDEGNVEEEDCEILWTEVAQFCDSLLGFIESLPRFIDLFCGSTGLDIEAFTIAIKKAVLYSHWSTRYPRLRKPFKWLGENLPDRVILRLPWPKYKSEDE